MKNSISNMADVSVRGRLVRFPAISIGSVIVVSKGRFIKTGEIFDEYWLQREHLPSYVAVIAELKNRNDRPDIFTFAQRVPDIEPVYTYYHEFDNYAVLQIQNYDDWLEKIPPATRRNIRASTKRGIVIQEAAYDDQYVKGIMSIYNETPVRQGRQFWHYGKGFEAVKAENGTFADRSISCRLSRR